MLASYLPWLGIAASAVQEPAGYWMGAIHGPVAATLSGGTVIHTKKLAALLKMGDVMVIDVSDAPRRPDNLASGAVWLPLPHPVIPGALWIPGRALAPLTPPSTSCFASAWRRERKTTLRTGS